VSCGFAFIAKTSARRRLHIDRANSFENIPMSDAAGGTPRDESEANSPVPAEAAKKKESEAPPRGRLLPYYFANLAVVYLPSLLPLALEVRRNLDEVIGIDVRTVAVDALAAPWAGLKLFFARGVFSLAPWLGNVGSLYAFLLTLWVGTLLVSLLYCNDRRRYRLTFVLFVLSTVQAIFVAERFVSENHQPPPVQQVGEPAAN